jgi:hypothetical protein
VEVVIQEGRVPASVDQGAAPSRWVSGVRNQPERVSAFDRNACPDSSGFSVRFRPDYTTRRAVDELIQRSGARPVASIEGLDRFRAGLWDSEDDLKAFLSDVRASRVADA